MFPSLLPRPIAVRRTGGGDGRIHQAGWGSYLGVVVAFRSSSRLFFLVATALATWYRPSRRACRTRQEPLALPAPRTRVSYIFNVMLKNCVAPQHVGAAIGYGLAAGTCGRGPASGLAARLRPSR